MKSVGERRNPKWDQRSGENGRWVLKKFEEGLGRRCVSAQDGCGARDPDAGFGPRLDAGLTSRKRASA
ncbi:hypothetical protein L6452_02812 [Arctium lappa]|uniref:Uncharacterized protein n=1 Tax=Arctium lappa TaxID=4217 RepID=A0ACB9FLD3_ARCLA|nr:hypothetical protein L6452_02812 [Arctium lappa]